MKLRTERGTTLVETAVVITLFFTLVFATIEFGCAYNMYHGITNAARAGARFSVAPCSFQSSPCNTLTPGQMVDETAVEKVVKQWLVAANIDPSSPNVVITVQQSETVNVNNVQLGYTRVHVEAPYSFLFLPFGPVTLKSDAVMRNENN